MRGNQSKGDIRSKASWELGVAEDGKLDVTLQFDMAAKRKSVQCWAVNTRALPHDSPS